MNTVLGLPGRFTCCCAFLLIFLVSGAVSASAMVVSGIEIEGNEKTRDRIILQEMFFDPGDTVTQELIDDSIQAIKDLGLFELVEAETIQNADGTVVTRITVKEKRFNFILPKLNRNGDGDITTGVVWRSDNLFGLNQQSKFTVAYEKFKDADEDDEVEIAWEYLYPRINGSPYSLEFDISNKQTNLEETIDGETGKYERDRNRIEVIGGRWVSKEGPSRGISVNFGVRWEDYEHTFVSGTEGLLPDVTVQALIGGVTGYYVHDLLLSRSGTHYGYELIASDDSFGSEVNFLQHFVFYRRYIPLPIEEHSNLNFQLRLGSITRSILGTPQFNIGGSRGLRGYEREAVEGNSFFIFNSEWLHPILDRETLRSALFFDIGNAWDELGDARLSDLRYGVGAGLRWKLKRFVKTDVRLDVAYGLSDGGTTKVYLGTRSTF